MPRVTYYFDLGSPYAYLSAERLDALLTGEVRWQPVLLGGLFKLTGRSSWALGDYRRRQAGMARRPAILQQGGAREALRRAAPGADRGIQDRLACGVACEIAVGGCARMRAQHV